MWHSKTSRVKVLNTLPKKFDRAWMARSMCSYIQLPMDGAASRRMKGTSPLSDLRWSDRCKSANDDEDAVRRGVDKPVLETYGNPTGLATQMSHKWIAFKLRTEDLTSGGERLRVCSGVIVSITT